MLQLRVDNNHAGKGVVGILRWLFWRLRRVWPSVRIILRADAGFSLPEILGVCERCGVRYAIGFARNAVTERKIAPLFEQPAQEVYDRFYVQRGAESEHRIKELKLGIQADRLSCHSFVANQFRLLLSQAAYILLLSIRQAAAGTQFTSAQVERLRALLIKGAARVRVSVRQVGTSINPHFSPSSVEKKVLRPDLCLI